MITELVPADCRTQAIGIYWAARSAAIVPASLTGGLIWWLAGPEVMLWCAGGFGALGAGLFFLRVAGGRRVSENGAGAQLKAGRGGGQSRRDPARAPKPPLATH